MSQKSNFVNFLIQGTNGQPKMVKVVQNVPKQPVPQMKIKPQMLRIPIIDNNTQTPVYHSVKVTDGNGSPKVVHVPLEVIKQLQNSTKEVSNEAKESHQIKVDFQSSPDSEHAEIMPKLVPIQKKQIESTSSTSYSSTINAMSHSSKRRHMGEDTVPEYTTKRRKHADKVGKGLRHFSMKVCEKVRNKGFTSYNEVADELVAEFAAGIHGSPDNQYDQKNIRRRVYDALNVLMAMNIISKEKKEIRWLGLPTNSVQECTALEQEKQNKIDQIQEKTQQLQELILRHISFKNLIERNKETEDKGLNPSTSSAIHLPFIVVNTDEDAIIQCSISSDKTEYMFNFNKKFHLNDDVEILKRMGLHFGLDTGKCTKEDIEKAKKLVPKSLENFVEQMGQGIEMNVTDLLADEEYLEDDDDVDEEAEGGGDDDQDYSNDSSDDIDV